MLNFGSFFPSGASKRTGVCAWLIAKGALAQGRNVRSGATVRRTLVKPRGACAHFYRLFDSLNAQAVGNLGIAGPLRMYPALQRDTALASFNPRPR